MAKNTPLLTPAQGQLLVRLARETLKEKLNLAHSTVRDGGLESDEGVFQRHCGVFVTLNKQGGLRGCIGSLGAQTALWEGVRAQAVNAAFHDPRFSELTADELVSIHIEISVLTEPRQLVYRDGADLIGRLRPGVDGVILRKGSARATYLPQVWEQLPDPAAFVSSLCQKAGLPADTWKKEPLEVETYQVQSFEEE